MTTPIALKSDQHKGASNNWLPFCAVRVLSVRT
jgi:hypothetical protein